MTETNALTNDLYPKMDMLLLIVLHKSSSYQNEIKVYRFFYTKQTIGFILSWRHTYIVHTRHSAPEPVWDRKNVTKGLSMDSLTNSYIVFEKLRPKI